ncbi:MAG: DUF499 domain-containing protein [Armatimonadetes bacterium]|nr:DUF499 domain-containing protein [Armatimonadota bacterium]NIO97506.1 DUF499 domain-containing protein [Armatimonadota bacterium]
MPLKPWFRVIDPREDLKKGRPLDAAEFAVHLDKVRDGSAGPDYSKPERFFERNYMTQNLLTIGSQTLRRLSGITTETSAVFNLATQFGGGKTHALTMLYHLAGCGKKGDGWKGVDRLKQKAGIKTLPKAAVATFVGTEFDSLTGRGGDDGTPLRKTPWGEIAWQLGTEKSFAAISEHESQMTAPAGDVIRRMLPKGKPSLILIDELMNYVSRNRKSGLVPQLYDFLHSLSETARSEDNVVLAVSIPASELEMNAEDHADYGRFRKMLDRLGKSIVMSDEEETSEIVRRRLFEWGGGVPKEGKKIAAAYAEWMVRHRDQLPKSFPIDRAKEAIEATYPFHPTALSVFERKWQSLPRFQQTRGILRLLALWVSIAYKQGWEGASKDPLIGLGTAPLYDSTFRSAALEQLGEQKLDVAITADICGGKDAHAERLDAEAVDTIKKARLHRKVATTVFFESNGGQAKEGEATVPEIRLAVGEPDMDIGNIETALEALSESCYYMCVERNKYRFGLAPNLNKLLSDRRANIDANTIEEISRAEIQKAFDRYPGAENVLFPEESREISDGPVLRLALMSPDHSVRQKETRKMIETMIREHGESGRTHKNAVLFAVADDAASLREQARRLLAWQAIRDEESDKLDDRQKTLLVENIRKAQRDLRETVWRTYNTVVLLGNDNAPREVNLGLPHSSQTSNMTQLIIDKLRQDNDIEPNPSPNFLVRKWPPAFREWSTKAVRDAFFSSPQFPRLLDGDAVKDTIARGVSNGILAYVGKTEGGYQPFIFGEELSAIDIEISDDMFIIKAEEAKKHIEPPELTSLIIQPEHRQVKPGEHVIFQVSGLDQHGHEMPVPDVTWEVEGGRIDEKGGFTADTKEGEFLVEATAGKASARATVVVTSQPSEPRIFEPTAQSEEIRGLRWSGEVTPQKWMNFYTKVLSRYATSGKLRLTITFEAMPEGGLQPHSVSETKAALRELGLDDSVETTG